MKKAKRKSVARPRRPARSRPPLAGVRVIDFTRILAGPFGSMFLGDMGAEVIKVEEPGQGRRHAADGRPSSAARRRYFLAVNRSKKSLTLNMKAPEGQAILRKLVTKADVVLENFRPGTMERLGFGYEALRALNPRLVYCSISGFGESGPEASRPGYDLIIQGESGVMDITGFPDGPPVKVGNSIADLVAGMAAAQGITLALLARERTGRGQKVEIGMLDVMASLLTYQAGLYLNAGGRPGRRGNQHPSIVPYEVFRAQDAYLTLGVANNSLWEKTCRALGRPDLARDPRFDSDANRVTNRDALIPLLNDVFGTRPVDEWVARLEAGRRARRQDQDGGGGVREPAPEGARHDGQARRIRRPARSPSWACRSASGTRPAPRRRRRRSSASTRTRSSRVSCGSRKPRWHACARPAPCRRGDGRGVRVAVITNPVPAACCDDASGFSTAL